MGTQVLILAAGEAKRFNGVSKQLLRVGDETILDRIIRQAKAKELQPLVSTTNEEIQEHLGVFHVPSKSATVCETFLSTLPLWQKRTVILLGDVIYSNGTFNAVMDCTDPIRVFGNTWEIFAVTFDETVYVTVVKTLEEVIQKGLDKLRHFYKVYCGFEPNCEEKEATPLEQVIFWYVHDWTNDMDLPYKYDNFLKEVVNRGLLES